MINYKPLNPKAQDNIMKEEEDREWKIYVDLIKKEVEDEKRN